MTDYFLIALSSAMGAEITFYLIHGRHWSVVRSSSASALAFALLTSLLPYAGVGAWQAAFFGATFVGMTSNRRLGAKRVFLASLLFTLIFVCVIPSLHGLGGGLGTAAFVSSSAVYFLGKALPAWAKAGRPG